MRNITEMTSDELQDEWLACEQYLNDPEPNNPERYLQASNRQLSVEREQEARIKDGREKEGEC